MTFIYLSIGLIFIIFASAFIVQQQNVAVIETFGRFSRIAHPGLNFMIPVIQKVAGKINLRVNQLDVKVETKTEDNVFLHVLVSVQFYVQENHAYEAFYKLQDPNQQITAFVFDVVRARVPKIKLDDVFEKKDEIADAVKDELSQVMNEFGYGIVKTLVTDIDPDKKVKEAMNEINVAQRMRVAATEKGEADRIIKVKAAEAEAQSKALQGQGLADQRTAIIAGLKNSVTDFKTSLPGTKETDIMNLVLMTQYFDTLKDLGNSANHNTIMVPHSPGAVGDIMQQFTNSLLISKTESGEPSKNESKFEVKNPDSEAKNIVHSSGILNSQTNTVSKNRIHQFSHAQNFQENPGEAKKSLPNSPWQKKDE